MYLLTTKKIVGLQGKLKEAEACTHSDSIKLQLVYITCAYFQGETPGARQHNVVCVNVRAAVIFVPLFKLLRGKSIPSRRGCFGPVGWFSLRPIGWLSLRPVGWFRLIPVSPFSGPS